MFWFLLVYFYWLYVISVIIIDWSLRFFSDGWRYYWCSKYVFGFFGILMLIDL